VSLIRIKLLWPLGEGGALGCRLVAGSRSVNQSINNTLLT